jgi:pantothenate kinase
MANIWFETNKRKIEAIKRQLIEYNYAGSYGGSINLMEVNNIIDGLLIEVTKLDREIQDLKKELKEKE